MGQISQVTSALDILEQRLYVLVTIWSRKIEIVLAAVTVVKML
jgi:hypothetical protein